MPPLNGRIYQGHYGYWVEFDDNTSRVCSSWILLPAENLWSPGVRGFLYIVALVWFFLGLAITSDLFMMSIETITSKEKIVKVWEPELKRFTEYSVLIWNETVANLTLMALGSSAPEILLATIECISLLFKPFHEPQDSLGFFTITGSAAYNLLVITAICIVSVPSPASKKIFELRVFAVTTFFSILAYVWMFLVAVVFSPSQIEIWEATLTLLFFPLMVFIAYSVDVRCAFLIFRRRKRRTIADATVMKNVAVVEPPIEKDGFSELADNTLSTNVGRVSHGPRQTTVSGSNPNGEKTNVGLAQLQRRVYNPRARFRHAIMNNLLGGPKFHVSAVLNNRPITPRFCHSLDLETTNRRSSLGFKDDQFGKITFSAPTYSVLESAGQLDITVIFHRRKAHINSSVQEVTTDTDSRMSNGYTRKSIDSRCISIMSAPRTPIEESTTSNPPALIGEVSVTFDTKEGSARFGKDFVHTTGILKFKATEEQKTISIPIINDNQYENDVDFLCILRNPVSNQISSIEVGDPGMARVTIIDDDEPGEFSFEQTQFYADSTNGVISAKVIRQHGSDGTASIQFTTIDGTAVGGNVHLNQLSDVDYEFTEGELHFEHGETSKYITIPFHVGKIKLGSYFLLTLRNASVGASIGNFSAAVMNLTTDEFAAQLDELQDISGEAGSSVKDAWIGQIRNAMSVFSDKDENGNEIPPSWHDYLLHFLSFFWKVLFALIPPRRLGGAWPTFFLSLLCIAALIALIEQLGHLLGCVIGLHISVTGITIIALGTSLPDTLVSRTAAKQDNSADAAIGNITGSNSVNVFLGLGLPWLISSVYHESMGRPYRVKTDNLLQSVVIFTCVGCLAIGLLIIRRKAVGGELGGPKVFKWLSFFFLITLWLTYVVLASLKAYGLFW